MKKNILFSALLALLLLGCNTSSTPSADASVSSDDPVADLPVSEFAARPEDDVLVRGEAFVLNTDVLSLESFPVQFTIVLKGNLPTPCHQLRVATMVQDDEQKIVVDVYSVFDSNELCAEVIQEFEVNIPLGSFPGKQYTIWVNGIQVAEISG